MKVYANALSEEASKKKQYYCVDLFKFICALMVVAIHIAPLSSYSTLINYGIQNYLARVAVPFFFVASGYFLFRKTSYENFDKTIPLAYAKRIFRLYVIWTVIYFPRVLRNSILRDEKGIVHGFLCWIRNCIFTGSYTQLWYLNATIVATLILTFCIYKKIKVKIIIVVGAILYAVGLLPQTYTILLKPIKNIEVVWLCLKFLQKIIVTTSDGLFEGFLFMSIGMFFAYKPVVMKYKTAIIGFICSMIIFCIEAAAVGYLGWARATDMYIGLVPATFFMFYIATHTELNYKPIYKHLRELSILIFYLHLFIIKYVFIGLNIAGINNSLLLYSCTVLITGVVSECVIRLSHRPNFRWLKKIYA